MQARRWMKSSKSVNGETCVELASMLDAIRDSKDPNGPILRVDAHPFVQAIKAGRFNR